MEPPLVEMKGAEMAHSVKAPLMQHMRPSEGIGVNPRALPRLPSPLLGSGVIQVSYSLSLQSRNPP